MGNASSSSWTSGDADCLDPDLGRQGRPRPGPPTMWNASSRTTDDGEGLVLDLGRRGMPRPGPRATLIAILRTSDDGEFLVGSLPILARLILPKKSVKPYFAVAQM